ncbi:MAG TPA: serine hydrolase domain-containing protein, partial [Flavisolibacter sp.]
MRKFITGFIAIAFSIHSNAQSIEQKMDALMNAYVGQKKFNGSVLVAQKGKVLYQKGFGYRNAEDKIANDANSIFQIGSITKQFTSAIIMQLMQEKKLKLDDKLEQYFPGFPNGNKITIEHLLTHTSGLFNYTNDSVIMNGDVSKSYSHEELLKKFRSYPPDFEPGSKWNYSNTGYSLLGYIIEKVERKPYETVARERILGPLGMTNSGFDFTHFNHPNKTRGYFIIEPSIVRAPIVDSTLAYSAGALYSTVGDLYKWERAISSDKILKPESWKAVFTPYKNKYGYGWSIDSLYGKPFASHGGGIH